jgi:ubiquinol-cytochrome c reductase cytochrome c1 subunit
MRTLLAALLFVPATLLAAEGGQALDPAPIDPRDVVSLQSGARTFVNYCLNCHGAQYMRYNRLADLGLSEAQIVDNLMFAADKVGDTMHVAMTAKDGKAWFGVPPPDLSVIGRSRGADWLYTYLRTFYRDPKTPTGWNNAVYPNVAMPHALYLLQGEQTYDAEKKQWAEKSKGAMSRTEYDATVRDLVAFLAWIGEPHAAQRKNLGIAVLLVLALLIFPLTYWLKKEYWKDVK